MNEQPRRRGRPPLPGEIVKTRLSPALLERVDQAARDRVLSRDDLVRLAVSEFVRSHPADATG